MASKSVDLIMFVFSLFVINCFINFVTSVFFFFLQTARHIPDKDPTDFADRGFKERKVLLNRE